MMVALELGEVQRVSCAAERLCDASQEWLDWCSQVQKCASASAPVAQEPTAVKERVELQLRRALDQSGTVAATELVPLSKSLSALVQDSPAVFREAGVANAEFDAQLTDLQRLLRENHLLSGKPMPSAVEPHLRATEKQLSEVKKIISKICKS